MPRVRCPRCNHGSVWGLKDGRKRCAVCRYSFWSGSRRFRKTSQHLHRLVEYFCLGVPARRVCTVLPLSPRTVERVFRVFRELIYAAESAENMSELAGTLELDESAYGGRHHGRRGWGAPGKTFVFGIYKRNGTVRVFPVPNRKHTTLQALIEQHTNPGSLYFTDDYHAYASLALRGEHVVVKKELGKPVGRDHVNGIEGFWGYSKQELSQFRGVRKEYFHLYLMETQWRYNHRQEKLISLLKHYLQQQDELLLGAGN